MASAVWSAVPWSSMSATRAARPAVFSSSTSAPPSTKAWMLTSGRLACRFTSTRSPLGSRTSVTLSAAGGRGLGGGLRAPPGGAMVTRLSRSGTNQRRAASRTSSAVTFWMLCA